MNHARNRRRLLALLPNAAEQHRATAPECPPSHRPGPAVNQHKGVTHLRSMAGDDTACLTLSIEVPAPAAEAYEAWTKLELPYFMRGTTVPEYLDGAHMTWSVRTLFDQFAWQAKVCEVTPWERVVWKSEPGAPRPNFGSVRFEGMDDHHTSVIIHVEFEMSDVYQWLGSPLPSLTGSLERMLLRFRDILTGDPPAEQEPVTANR